MTMWDSICYLNGEYMALQDAKISVLDRGFIFGDGVYEVVPLYNGKPFEWAGHLARLKRSLAAVQLTNPFDDAGWQALVEQLSTRNSGTNQFIYWQITRGVAKRDQGFPKPSDAVPVTVFAMSTPFTPPTGKQIEEGISGYTTQDNRWLRCDVKSISLLGNVLKRQEAQDHGATEAVMFRDGFLTEGAAANLWVVKDGTVLCPPRDHHILQGIRVGLMDKLCARAGIPLLVRPITKAEVLAADEMLLSSATKEILPMTRINDAPVGHGQSAGKPGPIWARLFAAYQAEKAVQCPL
jgi:D-alanine transaminase